MKIMVNSIPKGGTHLLLKLVYLLGIPDDPKRFWLGAGQIRLGFEPLNRLLKGSYSDSVITIGSEVPVEVGARWLEKKISKVPDNHSFGAHCLYSENLSELLKNNEVIPVCILRDPRAIAASHMHYVKKWTKHFFHNEYMKLDSDYERMRFSITGGTLGKYTVKPLAERYRNFAGWGNDPSVALVRFEDLIGSSGGGSDLAQFDAIKKVADHLLIDVDEQKIALIQEKLFGRNDGTQSDTFRKGTVDSWQSELDDSLKQLLDQELSGIMAELGYDNLG